MTKYIFESCILMICLILSGIPAMSQETCYDGVCFPQGDQSFADQVIRYIPDYSQGCVPWHSNFLDPQESLGPPDYTGGSTGTGSVSLGDGGLLEIEFIDNLLTNSGDSSADLWVFEVGPEVEACHVALRPADDATRIDLESMGHVDSNGDGFYEVGMIGGSTAGIDIDAWAVGLAAGMLKFDAVQLIDVYSGSNHQTCGADIDAVGAIQSEPKPVCDAGGPYAVLIGEPIQFDGSGSYATNSTIVAYEWDFGDGNTGSGIAPTHTYVGAGLYTVTLCITDDLEYTSCCETGITVLGACCFSDLSCQDMTVDDCAAAGGFFVQGGSCDQTDCQATPTEMSTWGRVKMLYR